MRRNGPNILSLVTFFATNLLRAVRDSVAYAVSFLPRWLSSVLSRCQTVAGEKPPHVPECSVLRLDTKVYTSDDDDTAGDGLDLVDVLASRRRFRLRRDRLCEHSEYFRALFRSRMQENEERTVDLSSVPCEILEPILDFVHDGRLALLTPDIVCECIETANYLVMPGLLKECGAYARGILDRRNCWSFLEFAESIACEEALAAAYSYLSSNFLELGNIGKRLPPEKVEKIRRLRTEGARHLCVLKKECAVPAHLANGSGRCIYHLSVRADGDEASRGGRFWDAGGTQTSVAGDRTPGSDGAAAAGRSSRAWLRRSELPFASDKWNFSTAVLDNYLYIIGGHRHCQGGSSRAEFRSLAYRYNPLTDTWAEVACMRKRRRRFSLAVARGFLFALGGWYLDALTSPDARTRVYSAVERYDPASDTWTFVSSLPFTDFTFSMTMTHDVPLAATLRDDVYAIGNIARTGEKLLLRYEVARDRWSEVLPTLTRAAVDLPALYCMVAAERLYVLGCNNDSSVLLSFSPQEGRWSRPALLPKLCLVGQGAAVVAGADGNGGPTAIAMPAPEQNCAVVVELETGAVQLLPELPFPPSHEAIFTLHFPA
ncbi:actin-binding protein IPP-like [Lethenteron reissneri]|uniref:actin-binding protein IPP-like n=1 Tax=Lethenteron reissneri TaxID=7753 RepID=UPI002AB70E9E|nr:actin-binding protein IPP-like [Lethenteron reissneri]